jgi:hypothetical protein
MQIAQNTLSYSTSYHQQEKKPFLQEDSQDINSTDESKKSTEDKASKKNATNQNELSQDEQQTVYELQARDTEVRAHEAAHQAAGGGLTGGANYSYQRGPDGKMYAIGGEVSISMPGGSTPEELISNAQQVIAAALAPADPSAQDMSVASSARALMIEAQQEKAKEAYESQNTDNSKKEDGTKEEEDSSLSKLDISA